MTTPPTTRRSHTFHSLFLGPASALLLTLTALPAGADIILPRPTPTSSQPTPPPAAPGKPASRASADDLAAPGRTGVWVAGGMLALGALALATARLSSRRSPRLTV